MNRGENKTNKNNIRLILKSQLNATAWEPILYYKLILYISD